MRNKSNLSELGIRILLLIVLCCPFIDGNVFANSAKSGEDCIDCHTEVWRSLQSKMYAHKPDRSGDCKCCHVPDRGGRGGGSEGYLDKVKWVASAASSGKEHWLEFDRAKMGATLLVETRSGKLLKVKELPLPVFDELEELPTSRMVPPTITNVRLQEVTKGVFVSATIAWETDVPADSQVFYGVDKLDQSSMLDRQPVKEHVVTLTGVFPGKTYKLKVVSANLAGNRVESAVKSVFVEIVGSAGQEKASQSGGTDLDVKVRCYRRGNNCFVIVSADQAVSVRLGIMPKKYVEVGSGEQPLVIRHLPLNTPEVTTIGICYNCHAEYKKILSHPVNVYPKRGMIIPPEYSTLPDGRISCMSCHADHASNIEFRLIKDRKEELCRGCHHDIR